VVGYPAGWGRIRWVTIRTTCRRCRSPCRRTFRTCNPYRRRPVSRNPRQHVPRIEFLSDEEFAQRERQRRKENDDAKWSLILLLIFAAAGFVGYLLGLA